MSDNGKPKGMKRISSKLFERLFAVKNMGGYKYVFIFGIALKIKKLSVPPPSPTSL
jgi:hypothetical protein